MDDTRDTILEDIYTLEPELRERDGEVRPLIEALVSANPEPEPRHVFVSALRAQLVPRYESPKRTARHSVNWWLVHLMPVGAIAILTLMLVPALTGPGMYGRTPTSAPSIATEMAEGPTAKSAGAPGDISLMQVATDMAPQMDSFTLLDQYPGEMVEIDSATLSVPGFVAVHRDEGGGPGAIVGTSTLLGEGVSGGIPVPLSISMREGETYRVMLYHDNGDGVYTDGSETPVVEPTLGTPIEMLFIVTLPRAAEPVAP